jgi:predicted transcriptional regulator
MLTREPSREEIEAAADAAADEEAMSDYEAGRFISHEAMRAWILSWGTPDELPRPEIGD